MLKLISIHLKIHKYHYNLNTSHVKVNPAIVTAVIIIIYDLNTSHVKVNQEGLKAYRNIS